MADPVKIEFQALGIAEVRQAFRTVEDIVGRLERAAQATGPKAARVAKQRVEAAKSEAAEYLKAEAAKTKATEKETAKREKEYAKLFKTLDKGEKEAAKIADAAERDKMRAAEKWAKQRERIQTNSALMAGRLAKRQADEEIREMERARHSRERFAKAIGSGVGRVTGRATSMAMGLAGAATALGGGFAIADVLGKATREQGIAADIANSGFIANDPLNNKVRKSSEIMGAARGVGIQYGMDTGDVLGGLQKFTGKTGRLDMGLETMAKLAELARATGSSFEDLADAAGDAFNADNTQSAEDVLNIMRAIAAQGKLGAVEIRDLASQMAKLSATSGFFKGDRKQNVIEMGILAQAARIGGGAASAEEAATSVQRFASDSAKKSGVFAKLGIHVESGKVLESPEEIIQRSLKMTGGKVGAITHLFGERSARAVLGFADIYRNAEDKKPGSGAQAVHAEFERFRKAAMSEAEVKEAAARRMQENDAKIAAAMQQLHAAVASELVPELTKLIPVLVELIPTFKSFLHHVIAVAQWFEKNPFAFIPSLIGGLLIKEFGAAAIGEAVKLAILRLLPSGSSPSGGGLGQAGKVAGIVGAAVVAEQFGEHLIDKSFGNETDRHRNTISTMLEGSNLAGKGKTMTPEELATAKAKANQMRTQIADLKSGKNEGVASKLFGGLANIVDPEAVKTKHQVQESQIKASSDALEKLVKAIEQSETALRALGGTAGNVPPPNPGAPHRTESLASHVRGNAP